MRHDIAIMIGTLIGWNAYGWLRSLHRWLDRAQEQADKEYPR